MGSVRILVLGDGDYTFSLDLALWLQTAPGRTNLEPEDRQEHEELPEVVQLVATGIDTLRELTFKYRDSKSVLKRLIDCATSRDTISVPGRRRITVSVCHGVNAVEEEEEEDATAQGPDPLAAPARDGLRSDVVIFNHPHLGTEDAQLHRFFLCHLFRAVDRRWLRSGGCFHLTLAHGQFQRWDCLSAGKRHGMTLVDRSPFRPPDVENPSYELRRHQSGKSFRTRREKGRSEIFTFVRTLDGGDASPSRRPFWIVNAAATKKEGEMGFHCSICAKSFREERSLRSHALSKHGGERDSTKKRRRDQDDKALASLSCSLCLVECDRERIFDSPRALEDHVRAKHTGLHKATPADTSSRLGDCRGGTGSSQKSNPSSSVERFSLGSCDICGYEFTRSDDPANHRALFLPVISAGDATTEIVGSYRCQFCSKAFREQRAQLQHENTCVILVASDMTAAP